MSPSSINKSVNVERRTWDKEAFKARARSCAAAVEASTGSDAAAAGGDANSENAATAGSNVGIAETIKAKMDPLRRRRNFAP